MLDAVSEPDPFIADWEAWEGREAFVAEVGDRELAFRFFLLGGRDAPRWLDERVPALGGAKPRNLLRTAAGRRRLRELAKRFPR